MNKNIDSLNEEIFLIDDVIPLPDVQRWWTNVINHGSWIQGFLAYGGNPPHISMDKTGDPEVIEKINFIDYFLRILINVLLQK